MKKFFTRNKIKSYIQITIGGIMVALGFYFFLSPCKLVIGGVTGLAIVLNSYLPFLSETVIIYALNIACLFLGLIFLGKIFFFKTIYGTILIPTVMAILELCHVDEGVIFNQIQDFNQLLVVTIMGSVLTGAGLGLVIRNGATTGGMDIPQRILSVKLHLPFSYVMYLIDGIIIGVGFFEFGIEKGIFAVASLFLTGYLVDVFSVGGTSKRAFYIITENEEPIKQAIFDKINRGATIVDAVGGYTNRQKKMIICILNKGQYSYLREIVNELDPQAFIYISKANEVIGEGFSLDDRSV